MKFGQTFSGLLVVIVAAFIGLALLYLPNWILSNYETASRLGRLWGTLYLIVIGTGLLLLLGSTLWTVWKLWGATIMKRRRKQRRSRDPSEMTASQKAHEIDENLEQIEALRSRTTLEDQLENEIDPLVRELEAKRTAQTLEIVAFGTISSGKSSVLNLLAGRDVFQTDARGGTTVTRNEIPWPGLDKVTLIDTPGLGEIDGEMRIAIAAQCAKTPIWCWSLLTDRFVKANIS